MKNSKGFIGILVGIVIALGLLGGGYYFYTKKMPIDSVSSNKVGSIATIRGKNLAKINTVREIETALELYFIKNRHYPISLPELNEPGFFSLPKDPNGSNYLYAYYPSRGPKAYHLGARLEEEGSLELLAPEDLKQLAGTMLVKLDKDADFDSEKAGYINGFSGTDPVFDVVAKDGGYAQGATVDVERVANPVKLDSGELAATRDIARISNIYGTISIGLKLYFDINHKYPKNLNELNEKYIRPYPTDSLTKKDYYYATTKDLLHYHIGALLEKSNDKYLNEDSDLNSALNSNWTNGFDGKDPVIDIQK